MAASTFYKTLLQTDLSTCSTLQLLALLLGPLPPCSAAQQRAQQLLDHVGSLSALFRAEPLWLATLPGMRLTHCITLKATAELLHRSRQEGLENQSIFTTPNAVTRYLISFFTPHARELFIALFLNNKHHLLHTKTLFQGSIDRTAVYPREVVKTALLHNASAIILAHNHPSGDPEPSPADYLITEEIMHACHCLDIRLLDHIVVGKNSTFSFVQQGCWPPKVNSQK